MSLSQKVNRPSSPREFFARLYGHLEDSKEKDGEKRLQEALVSFPKQNCNVAAPVPILATPLPFILPTPQEAQLSAAAAAGLTAFRKFLSSSLLTVVYMGIFKILKH